MLLVCSVVAHNLNASLKQVLMHSHSILVSSVAAIRVRVYGHVGAPIVPVPALLSVDAVCVAPTQLQHDAEQKAACYLRVNGRHETVIAPRFVDKEVVVRDCAATAHRVPEWDDGEVDVSAAPCTAMAKSAR